MYRYPGQRKLGLSASELNRQNHAADRVAFSRLGMLDQTLPDDQQSHWVWLRNDSGADRGRFDCMSLGDPLYDLLEDGTVDLLFSAGVADAEKTAVILLEPIADGAFGKGVIHGMAMAWVGPGEALDRTAEPDPENHRLLSGSGSIKLLGPPGSDIGELFGDFFDDFHDDFFDTDEADGTKLLPVLLGAVGATGESILAKTPVGGIAACAGAGPYTFGSETCTIVGTDGVVTAETEVIKNIVSKAIAGSVIIKADLVGSIYVVDVASCPVE